jgi:nucleotide-binding universal stress UspA family protein
MLLEAITPNPLEAGPPPGQWRRELVETRSGERLFGEVLVALDDEIGGWLALEAALMMAQHEQGCIYGLHVTPAAVEPDNNRLQALQAEFNRCCQAANVPGDLAIEAGPSVAAKICDRARWTDLVVVSLTHPPASQLLARLGSGFHTLVRRCPRPILAVPTSIHPTTAGVAQLQRTLLAYDSSPKAQEALFVATYLAGSWQLPLIVVMVNENGSNHPVVLDHARVYLESHGIAADYVTLSGPVPPAILNTAVNYQASLIIMGGYGSSPVVEAVMGSSVDHVLRQSNLPVLICR